jgi:hypothetical protein
MKFIINDWRNKVARNTAENLIVAQSCFKTLNEMSTSVASQTRQQAATPSADRLPPAPSQGSPTPQDPNHAVVAQAAAGEDADPFIAHGAALAARAARKPAVRRTPVEEVEMQHVEYDEEDPAAESLPAYVSAALTPAPLTASVPRS